LAAEPKAGPYTGAATAVTLSANPRLMAVIATNIVVRIVFSVIESVLA